MISTNSTVAVRCPECGKIEYITVSLFSFSHENINVYKCSCDAELMKITTKKRKDFWIQYNCVMCEGLHLLKLTRKQIWLNNKMPFDLICDETGIEVGYIGSYKMVKEKVKNQDQSLAEMADKLGFTEFFNNSSVMYEVLEHIYDIAERGNLYCYCGNFNVNVEIFPEYVELSCEKCKAKGKIMADKEEDIEIIKNISELKLTRKGFLFNHTEDYNKRNY